MVKALYYECRNVNIYSDLKKKKKNRGKKKLVKNSKTDILFGLFFKFGVISNHFCSENYVCFKTYSWNL